MNTTQYTHWNRIWICWIWRHMLTVLSFIKAKPKDLGRKKTNKNWKQNYLCIWCNIDVILKKINWICFTCGPMREVTCACLSIWQIHMVYKYTCKTPRNKQTHTLTQWLTHSHNTHATQYKQTQVRCNFKTEMCVSKENMCSN